MTRRRAGRGRATCCSTAAATAPSSTGPSMPRVASTGSRGRRPSAGARISGRSPTSNSPPSSARWAMARMRARCSIVKERLQRRARAGARRQPVLARRSSRPMDGILGVDARLWPPAAARLPLARIVLDARRRRLRLRRAPGRLQAEQRRRAALARMDPVRPRHVRAAFLARHRSRSNGRAAAGADPARLLPASSGRRRAIPPSIPGCIRSIRCCRCSISARSRSGGPIRSSHGGWLAINYFYFQSVVGWALSLLAVAGFSGLVKSPMTAAGSLQIGMRTT